VQPGVEPPKRPAPPSAVILGGPNVVPQLISALHATGVAAAWAVDANQASRLLEALPGSRVIIADDSVEPIGLPSGRLFDIRGVANETDDKWVPAVAQLIAGALSGRTDPVPKMDQSPADLVVDETNWCVRYRGRALRLTDAQYRLLGRLVRSAGRLVLLQELAQDMFDSAHSERQRIHAHVKRLRLRLASETEGRFSIVAVRGRGYRLSDNGELPLRSTG
jgi:Transcriptional regulatory protein, C terminal